MRYPTERRKEEALFIEHGDLNIANTIMQVTNNTTTDKLWEPQVDKSVDIEGG